MAERIQVGGRIESKEVGGIVTGAAEILDDAKEKKQSVINQETDDELVRLDQSKQDNLTFDNAPTEGSDNPVKSGGVYAADKALSDAIEAILLLIPSAASALNKLVDTSMMNSSISTATATFRGTYNVVTDLSLTVDATHEQIAAALGNAISTADNNDYAFVQVPVSAESTDIRRTERYKFNGTVWGYEYDLNTSGFTSAQWAAINSGITLALVGKLIGLPTSSELQALLGQKQDTLTFDNVPTAGSANPVKSGGVYSAINDEKTAREQLAQTVTGINGRVGDIEEVIPAGAAANNKLVANSSMEAYVTSIIEAITASFTIATADGHINLTLTQTNGRVASLTLTSSDIASAQALTALTGRVSTAESNITTLGGRVSTNETDIANLQQLYNDLQQSKPVPVTVLPETGQQQGVIYRLAGTTSYSDYMWNGSTWVLMATYNNAIDPRPKKASQNLVTSGGVFDNMGALDVSELNATENPHTLAQYVDLSAALAAIPTDYQKGGMSIKFVQSSDNKYVQYRLIVDDWSIHILDWKNIDEEDFSNIFIPKMFGGGYEAYNSSIDELYIFPDFMPTAQDEYLSLWCYGGSPRSIAIACGKGEVSSSYEGTWMVTKSLSSVQNGDIVEIKNSNNALVAIIIFKDIDTFRQTNFGNGAQSGPLNTNRAKYLGCNLKAYKHLYITPDLEEEIQRANNSYLGYNAQRVTEPGGPLSDIFETCIENISISQNAVGNKGNKIGIWCYSSGSSLALNCSDENNNLVWNAFMLKALSSVANGDKVNVIISAVGENSPVVVGENIGYVVFKDIATFKATTAGSASASSYINTNRASMLNSNYSLECSIKPTDTNFKPDRTKNYVLFVPGTYSQFGENIKVKEGDLVLLKLNTSNNSWEKKYISYDNRIYVPDSVLPPAGPPMMLVYEDCVDELYIIPEALNIEGCYVGAWCYGSGTKQLGLYCMSGKDTVWYCSGIAISGWTNDRVYEIEVTSASENSPVNVGETVAYIIFKDIATFRDNITGNANNSRLNIPFITDLQKQFKINKYISESGADNPLNNFSIQIPDIVYAVVGTELNIWNDTITLSADKGLQSPVNYQVEWRCGKGLITQRGFRFTPVAGDVGNVTCHCRLYDMFYNLIKTKTFTIKVLAKNALTSAKRIVYFGDSTGASTAAALYSDFNSDKFMGTVPTMLGTKGTTPKYEAVGGYRWADFATAGRRAFRCQVSNIGTIELNSRYTNNGFTWTVVEVNITSGSGNILITKQDVSGTDAPQINGTLVPVSSGDSIPYTNAALEGANPLWNTDEEKIDVALYRSRIGLGTNEKLDAVSFQLGLNNEDINDIETYITNLYNAFIEDNPNCIFILGLTTSSCNTADGAGANYGATLNVLSDANKMYYGRRNLYLSFVEKTGFNNLRIATPNLEIDRYYGYQLGTRNISQRFDGVNFPSPDTNLSLPAKEVYHTNYVHPATSGYGQMGDAFFAAYIGALTE